MCAYTDRIFSRIRLTRSYTDWIFIQSSAWPSHTQNEYPVGNPPDLCICEMNIQSDPPDPLTRGMNIQSDPPDPLIHWLNIHSTIHLTRTYVDCIFSWSSAWPVHMRKEYSVRSAWPAHTLTNYSFSHPPDPLTCRMNIHSTIRLTRSYVEWISSWSSAWPAHTWNEYSVRSAWPTHTLTEYSFSHPPDLCICTMNIQLVVRLTHLSTDWIFNWIHLTSSYAEWIFSPIRLTRSYTDWIFIPMLIEYLMGYNWVV